MSVKAVLVPKELYEHIVEAGRSSAAAAVLCSVANAHGASNTVSTRFGSILAKQGVLLCYTRRCDQVKVATGQADSYGVASRFLHRVQFHDNDAHWRTGACQAV